MAASFAGISPAINVRNILIIIRITPPATGSCATFEISVRCLITALAGIHNSSVTTIPSAPETKPSISVYALNILETSFLEAPILLNTPISLVLSSTEMYVIIPIIIEETISDIATNAINT